MSTAASVGPRRAGGAGAGFAGTGRSGRGAAWAEKLASLWPARAGPQTFRKAHAGRRLLRKVALAKDTDELTI